MLKAQSLLLTALSGGLCRRSPHSSSEAFPFPLGTCKQWDCRCSHGHSCSHKNLLWTWKKFLLKWSIEGLHITFFGKIKVQINSTERTAVGRPTPRGHYSSQNISETCQSSVIKLFTSYIVFLFFSFFFMGETVYLGRMQLTLPMPGCCFGSPRLWSSEGCCTAMGNSTLAHALQQSQLW